MALAALGQLTLAAPLANAAQYHLAQASSAAGSPLAAGLEDALNSGDRGKLEQLISPAATLDPALVTTRLLRLGQTFSDLHWEVSETRARAGGEVSLTIQVKGRRSSDGIDYRLEAVQDVAVSIASDGTITGQRILREESFVYSGDMRLAVHLQIPDAVRTGERYDVDVIVDEPLGEAVLAGGILEVTPAVAAALDAPAIQLGILYGGGLFKRVQAPYQGDAQTWAVMLLHPEGALIASKRVRLIDP